jgi:ribonucleotide reductase beta subunit family protein with ferritin-like domain
MSFPKININLKSDSDEEIEIDDKMSLAPKTPKIVSDKENEEIKKIVYSALLSNYDSEEEKRKDSEEDILNEDNERLNVIPTDPKYDIIFKLYKKQSDAMWRAEEIDLVNDANDFNNLPEGIQLFIESILAFFAGSDTIVNINIDKKLSKITIREAQICYDFQKMMENIHGEVYGNQLINIIQDSKKRNKLLNAYKTVPSIKKLTNWANAWIESDRRIGFSIVAFAIMEGVFFSGAFAGIYWLKKVLNGKMNGFIQSNNLIAKDEGMHVNFGALMYDFVIHRLSKEELETMIKEACEIGKEFMNDAIPIKLIGMNAEIMEEYIEYVCDRLAVILGYEKIYNTQLPSALSFMDSIGFLNKDNFFERRPTEYQKAYNEDNSATDYKFTILKDF